jgi:PPK2 family polyphosphate:nucleotide phosphotransferase
MSKQPLVPEPLSTISLADYDPEYTANYNKKSAREETEKLHERMAGLQEMLYAQGKHALLIVLQAMDAGGKDGAIKKVFEPINPLGVQVANFKAPTSEELAHDFLWRIHKHAPGKGYIGIFNRSHYEDVLIVRVNQIVPREIWEKRYDQINQFERILHEGGTRILKFYLHISKDEQKKRFQERLDDPEKRWKFSLGDLPVREKWNDYMKAYEDALTQCNTDHAPWHIVPANNKWYRDLVVTKAIVEVLESMDLAYPEPEANLDNVVISD